jgi:hypothetical protein
LVEQFISYCTSGSDISIFIRQLIFPTLLVALAVVAFQQLEGRFGLSSALGIWAGAMGCACLLGACLLWNAPIGKIGWQNRIAGFLLPWGARLSRGKLWPIVVVSWIVWMAIAGAISWLFPVSNSEENLPPTWTRIVLLVAWIIDGHGLLYVLGTLSQNFSITSKSSRTLMFAAAAIAMILVGSLILYRAGLTLLALTLAGGPPAVLGIFFVSFSILVLFAGRKGGWH